MPANTQRDTVIKIQDIHTRFGEKVVHSGVSFEIKRGTVNALIGGSGTGKSVLLNEIIGLLRPASGSISVLGTDVWTATEEELSSLRKHYGVLFQDGALFSALTVGENVAVPLVEQTNLPESVIEQIVELRLWMSGLKPEVARLQPSELSGGMRKRAALARALALEPEILFLDEPTSGLDPVTARAFDELIRTLADSLNITILLTTHDLDTLYGIVDNVIVLSKGKVIAEGSLDQVRQCKDEWLQKYFSTHSDRAS